MTCFGTDQRTVLLVSRIRPKLVNLTETVSDDTLSEPHIDASWPECGADLVVVGVGPPTFSEVTDHNCVLRFAVDLFHGISPII
jgi:hypothetical protein